MFLVVLFGFLFKEMGDSMKIAVLSGNIGLLIIEFKYMINIFILEKLNRKFRNALKSYLNSKSI